MIIKYSRAIRGIRFYQVIEGGDDIFMGTLGECKRFITIHNQKILSRLEMERQARAG
ncbi:MAG: hypothetical protein KDB53_13775 [Planctomycetes bacterium]|nr:hypothetical protein [Planctomycetota bacterium]